MDTKNLQNQIAVLEAQIEALPKGSVAKKSVNGKRLGGEECSVEEELLTKLTKMLEV